MVEKGGKSWYFLTADYAFGKSLEDETGAVVKQLGGTVAGSARHPVNTPDFSSFLLQAQSSTAGVLGLASAGGDAISALKSAQEFGVTRSMKVVGLAMTLNDVHGAGPSSIKATYAPTGAMYTTCTYSRSSRRRSRRCLGTT